MTLAADLDILTGTISSLSSEQATQVLRQIEYHLTAAPHEDLALSKVISLQLDIGLAVTRPMSSKGLAKWLWKTPDLYYNKRVLDMGTGCGIQGLTCLLGGAEYALMTDVSEESVKCAQSNLRNSGLSGRGEIAVSDLFDDLEGFEPFDLIVFAQPYFVGCPIPQYPFTRGMLTGRDLLPRFFQSSRRFLRPSGCLALMGWVFAGSESDPTQVGPQYGFEQIWLGTYRDDAGIQRGEFHIVLFK